MPIYGVLFSLSDSLSLYKDYGGVLLVSISTIFVVIGKLFIIQVSGSLTDMFLDLLSLVLPIHFLFLL